MQKTIAQITPRPALQDALKIYPVCQIKCAGQKSGSFDAPAETFFPQNEYRTEANGGLVPLLSVRLQLLGDQACESTAIDRCRGKDRVEEVRAMSLFKLSSLPITRALKKWKFAEIHFGKGGPR